MANDCSIINVKFIVLIVYIILALKLKKLLGMSVVIIIYNVNMKFT